MGASGPAEDSRGGGVPFGRYAIRARLGRGGMGEVFLADQLGPRGPLRAVALKRVLPRFSEDVRAVDLFLSEMQTAAQLNHPNIATTYDFGEVDGVYFMAMEYVDGITVDRLLSLRGALPVPQALAIVKGVAAALAYAHDQDVVHQDVSPHNVMVSRQGAVKLLDFGIARAEAAVHEGVRAKIAYAAPEQLEGAPPDRRFDLWALGVFLYEMIAGRRPFVAPDARAMVNAAHARSFDPLQNIVPNAEDVARIIDGALAPKPEQRWRSAEAMARAMTSSEVRRPRSTAADLAALVQGALADQPSVDLSETSATGVAAIDVQVLAALENAPRPARPPISETSTTAPTPAVPPSTATIEAEAGVQRRVRWPIVLLLMTAAVAAYVLWSPQTSPPPVAAVLDTAPTIEPDPPVEAEPTFVLPAAPPTTEKIVEPKAKPRAKKRPHKRRRQRHKRVTPPSPPPESEPVEGPGQPRLVVGKRSDGLGLLSVRSTPWAKVALDGRPIGEGVIARKPVAAGPHVLTLTPGQGTHEIKTVRFEIRPGVTTKIFADFARGTVRVEP